MLQGEPSRPKGLRSGRTVSAPGGKKVSEFSYLGHAKHLVPCAAHASLKLSDVLLLSISTVK